MDVEAAARSLSLPATASLAKVQEALMASMGTVDLNVPLIRMSRLRLPVLTEAAVDAAIQSLSASPLVKAAEPDHPVKMASAGPPNDPLYANGEQSYLDSIHWTQAFEAAEAGTISLTTAVTVAIIDTGVGVHTDLSQGQVLMTGSNFVTPGNPTTDDNGHGTFCTGLMAAATNNSTGMSGVFFATNLIHILPVKVLDSCGSGSTSNLAAGISFAVAQGARVINMSIQSDSGSDALEDAVDQARDSGVLIVAAAGNDDGPTSYPATYAQVLAVAALTHDDQRTSYSNYGKLELSAPGGDLDPECGPETIGFVSGCQDNIWSLYPVVNPSCNPAEPQSSQPNSYFAGSGTSFAAPMVTAAAALLFSQDPSRQVEDVERILEQTASATAYGAGYNGQTGWGKLNVYGALTYQSTAQTGSAGIKAYNWPNPFNPDKDRLTTLTFFLPVGAATTLRLFDGGGDLVKQWQLSNAQAYAGMNLLTWDGHNGVGAPVANGAYTLVVDSAGKRATAVVAVIR
jgi:serine protease